jgi:antitoxin HicB
MSKPNYRVILHYDVERKVFLARVPELAHCTAEGPSRSEAMRLLEEEIDAQLANMLSHGTTPPRAVDEEEYSGEVACKLSRSLHRELAVFARSEGVELDHLVGELVASALEGRRQSPRGRHGNRVNEQGMPQDGIGNRSDGGGGGRGRNFGPRGPNPAMLDDRANFIEYVRTLDQGGGNGYGGRGQNQGPGGGGAGGGRGQRRRGPGGPGRGQGPYRPDGRANQNQNQGQHAQRHNPTPAAAPSGGQANTNGHAPPPAHDTDGEA